MNKQTSILLLVLVVVVAGIAYYFTKNNAVSGGQEAAATVADSKNINITYNPAVVVKGGSATIIWSSVGFNTCSIHGPTLDSTKALVAVKGSVGTGALTQTSTYRLDCQYKNGTVESKSITVVVH